MTERLYLTRHEIGPALTVSERKARIILEQHGVKPVDIGTVANLMGHRSPMMVLKHYQHVRDSQKKAAVEALPAPPTCVQDDVYKN